MKFKNCFLFIRILIFILFVLLVFCVPCIGATTIKIDELIFQGAYDVHIVREKPAPKVIAVDYLINLEFPAEELIAFLNSIFEEKGWKIYYPAAKRQWSTLTENDSGQLKKVHQYMAAWLNPDESFRAVLIVRFVEHKRDVISDRAGVICQLHPFTDEIKNYLECK